MLLQRGGRRRGHRRDAGTLQPARTHALCRLSPGLLQHPAPALRLSSRLSAHPPLWLQPLLRCGSLSHLELRSSGLANGAASSLAEVLATNGRLRHLDLQRNHIRCGGAIALAAAIQVGGAVVAVNLRFNEISDAGATALGKALADNKSIAELHLGERAFS